LQLPHSFAAAWSYLKAQNTARSAAAYTHCDAANQRYQSWLLLLLLLLLLQVLLQRVRCQLLQQLLSTMDLS
jgi:hypothetical protein